MIASINFNQQIATEVNLSYEASLQSLIKKLRDIV